MEEMTKEIRSEVSGADQARGSLTIRVPETLAAAYMPQIVEDFHDHHPGVKLIFINCSDRALREELNSGRIDLAFLMTDAVHFKEVNVSLMKTERLIMVSGPAHAFALKEKVSYLEQGLAKRVCYASARTRERTMASTRLPIRIIWAIRSFSVRPG